MSLTISGIRLAFRGLFSTKAVKDWTQSRLIQHSAVFFKAEPISETEKEAKTEDSQKDKVPIIDPLTSIEYMDSKAYSHTYGDKPVWFHYRRNFKGWIVPETRKTCIRAGKMTTGSPCPVCRDEYLVVDYRNVKLLEQFISPSDGKVIASIKTGVCQKQHKRLLLEVARARDYGFIEDVLPFREYDYDEYRAIAAESEGIKEKS
ncbi:hypothetical protein CHS0354_005442 [Potamilus streckersoni]|uniref:Small ribosomal subunit protein mS40 n=1 Tax=Potamilus streckersoni TaxID=2493646 RepID=A0AAE0WDU7_9BIVA|nr:hypothetical protein CHS0354_005442 [Potamilus streckersoni]